MSLSVWKTNVEKCLLDIVWCHWNKLGAHVHGPTLATNCDPEALVVLSLLLADLDPRLPEILTQWLAHYESAVNVERLKTAFKLLENFPHKKRCEARLHEVLMQALTPGSWQRWKKVAAWPTQKKAPLAGKGVQSRKKLQDHDWILKNNILLSFRFLLGANAKADVLYHIHHHWVSIESRPNAANIARALHYNASTIHRVIEELKFSLSIYKDSQTQQTQQILNRQMPLLCLPPREDSFFVDWFGWIYLALGVLELETEILACHPDVMKLRLKVLLEGLVRFLDKSAREQEWDFNNDVSVTEMTDSYLQGLRMAFEAYTQPSLLNWGADKLTEYFEKLRKISWASYSHLAKDIFRSYVKIDAFYIRFGEYLNSHAKEAWLAKGQNKIIRFLLGRLHSTFRAAIGLVMGGQAPEAIALSRLVLDHALHAFHMFENPKFVPIYEDYLNDAKSVRNKFRESEMIKGLTKKDHAVGSLARKLYASGNSFGAHPNVGAVLGNLERISEDENVVNYSLTHAGQSGPSIELARQHVKGVGLLGLKVFGLIDPQSLEKSGVTAELQNSAF